MLKSKAIKNSDSRFSGFITFLFYLLFFLSGITGLIYEVSWMRVFSLLLGSTTLAGTLTLAAFFSGLALGAWVFGRTTDRFGRPDIFYATIEIMLGIYALFSLTIFNRIDEFSGLLFKPADDHALFFRFIQFLLLWIILLFPTILMGGTLPVLSKYLIGRLNTVGSVTGKLYAINTLGAVFGTILSAFFLIRYYGISKTIFFASITNVAIGLTILLFRVFGWKKTVKVQETENFIQKSSVKTKKKDKKDYLNQSIPDQYYQGNSQIPLIVFISGFISLAGEVLWLRIFSISLDSSVQSFGIVLSIFLVGISLGSYIFSKVTDFSLKPLWWIGFIFCLSAILIAVITPFLEYLPQLYFTIIRKFSSSWSGTILFKYILAIMLLLPTTILIGGIFPLAINLFSRRIEEIGGSIGTVYAWNTMGGILGSMAGGLFLIPVLGIRNSFLLLAIILLLVGYYLFVKAIPSRKKGYFFVILIVLFLLLLIPIYSGKWQPEKMLVWWGGAELKNSNILFFEEGREANVAVVSYQDARSLFVGKKLVASDHVEGQKHLGLLAHIPLLIHHQPENILVIGLATGITLNSALGHGIKEASSVEINPLMLKAVKFFSKENQNIWENPRAKIYIADARHFLRFRQQSYDCITTDPIHPADANSNNLYSVEFYQLAKRALKKGGIMCQWLPAADLNPQEVKRVMSTFGSVFQYVSLWIPNLSDLALIGSDEFLSIDLNLIEKRLQKSTTRAAVSKHLGKVNVENFLSLFALGNESYRLFCQNVELNTDDKPILEYEAPKNLWNPVNLPDFYMEINEIWTNTQNELVGLIKTANPEMVENVLAQYRERRNENLLFIATLQSKRCLNLEKTGKFIEAMKQYQKMFSLFPTTLNPVLLDAFIGISLCYEGLNRPDKSLEFYEGAVNAAPTEVESRHIIAQSFWRRDLKERAKKEWERILEINPNDQEARNYLEIGLSN